jgi:hypothetical protein
LHCRAQQWLGEGIDVVLQIAQGLVQYALQTPLFFNQFLQVLAVCFPCTAIPLGGNGLSVSRLSSLDIEAFLIASGITASTRR